MRPATRPPVWLVSLALRCWPSRTRARHASSLRQTLDTAWAADASRSWWPRLAARTRLLLDLASAGVGQRLDARRERTGKSWAGILRAVVSDLRSAWRALRGRPVFTAAVVATLGVGLGFTTAIYAVVDAVLLRPLPYPADDRLVLLAERDTAYSRTGTSWPAVDAWRDMPELRSIAAYEESALVVGRPDRLERVLGAAVSPSFFTTLGVRAALGRTQLPGEPTFPAEGTIVLGDDLWRRHFDADASIVGRTIVLEEDAYQVLGVMPPGFAFPARNEFWRSLPRSMTIAEQEPGLRFLDAVARLADRADLGAVEARLEAWNRSRPADDRDGWHPYVTSLREHARGGVTPAVITAFAGVALLLAVACANVAALFVANGRTRARELSTRVALGASRARLVRQLITEGLLLSLAGTAVALGLTAAARSAIVGLSAGQIPRIEGIGIGAGVVGFALAAAVVVTIFAAAGPAFIVTGRRTTLLAATSGARAVAGSRGSRRLFAGLVGLEFALALVLVAGAGLLAESYRALAAVETGVTADRVGTARVVLPLVPAWQPNDARRRFFSDLETRLNALPGVEAAGFASRLPLDPAAGGLDIVRPDAPDEPLRALLQMATPGYFDVVGVRTRAGRTFTGNDRENGAPVAVLNDVAATALFGSPEAAIGQTMSYRFMRGPASATVVGVVAAVRYDGLSADLRPECYLPVSQGLVLPLALAYRTTGDPVALVPAIRQAVDAADVTDTVALDDIATLEARSSRTVARPRFFFVLVGSFAVAALLLAACGIYSSTAYWLNERWREFGVRVALGAPPASIVRTCIARAVGVAVLGVAAGLAAARAGGALFEHLLFGVRAGDLTTLGLSGLVLLLAATIACWLPARRVARIDPADTLRAQ